MGMQSTCDNSLGGPSKKNEFNHEDVDVSAFDMSDIDSSSCQKEDICS